MANAIDSVSNFLREELPKVLHESLPAIAPFFKDIAATAIGVKRDESAIGRTWKVIHLYSAGLAGLMKYANPLGPAMNVAGEMGKQVHLLGIGTAAPTTPFPTALEAPHAGSLKRELQLHMTTGNFSVPLTWMQADALSAAQIKQVARDIKGVGDLRAMIEATGFHSYPQENDATFDTKILGVISTMLEGGSNEPVITLHEEYGTIHNFRVGMVIDIVAGTGSEGGDLQDGAVTDHSDRLNYTAAAQYVHVLIQDVDYIGRQLTVVGIGATAGAEITWSDSNGWGDTGADKPAEWDYIVLKDCSLYSTATRPMPTWGLEDWMKSSGYLMSGVSGSEALDLAKYSQFKSSVTAVNGPLTEDVLNKYVGNYLDAYPGLTVDTILTTNGVTQKHLQQYGLYNNRQFFDRTGKSLKVKGGWAEVQYEFNGRVLRWMVDPLCLKGRLYGVKFGGDNIRRYVPPTISSGNERLAGSNAGIDGEVQFLAPLGGHSGVFMVARDTNGAVLDVLEAPFYQFNLIAPIDPRGIKLTGLTETALT